MWNAVLYSHRWSNSDSSSDDILTGKKVNNIARCEWAPVVPWKQEDFDIVRIGAGWIPVRYRTCDVYIWTTKGLPITDDTPTSKKTDEWCPLGYELAFPNRTDGACRGDGRRWLGHREGDQGPDTPALCSG